MLTSTSSPDNNRRSWPWWILGLSIPAIGLAFLINIMGWFDGGCPEFTEAEEAVADAISMAQSGGQREWEGDLVLSVDRARQWDDCGLMGAWSVKAYSSLRLSGAISETLSIDLEKAPSHPEIPESVDTTNPTLRWSTGLQSGDRWSGSAVSGWKEIDRTTLNEFLHGGAIELAMRSEAEGPFSLYLTSDSGIVAVENGDRFWGDSTVRDRVFLTVSEYPPSPPAL